MAEEPLVVSISSSTSLNPDEIARRTFPPLRKGVDGDAVRRYLESIADEIRMLLERDSQLRRRTLEAERRADEPPVLDEATLNRSVGAETARVLQTAHEAAREVVARAEAQAAELVAAADNHVADRGAAADREAAAVLEAAAEEAVALATAALAEATALQESARAEAETVLEAAQDDAVALLETTKQQCREAVREAQRRRKSVLSDLVERRRALFVQLEQLRSGRDSLVDVVNAVGGAVEDLRGRLARAEHDARVAAADAGDRAEAVVDEDVDSLLDPEVAHDLGDALLSDDARSIVTEVDVHTETGDVAVIAAGVLEAEDALEEVLEEITEDAHALDDLAEALDDEGETTELAQGDSAASHRSVGELFARIRAARGPDQAAVPDGAGASSEESGDETEEAGEAGETDEAGEAGETDAVVISRRDALVAPVMTRLARALKRALQDDQNELLNAIRHASGTVELDVLLPEDVQRERYAQAASGALADGWLVGRSWLRTDDSTSEDDEAAVGTHATETGRQLGTQLAGELAGLLRHRLTESLRVLGEVGEGAQEAAGAAYREWKGARVEGIAGDFATRAFAGGAVAAGEGTMVRWVVNDGRPCPDCDDNALAGEQPVGDEWPTGQLYPPVHPGCRCLLVAITH
jgi:cell division septum initiation protein DivIVA